MLEQLRGRNLAHVGCTIGLTLGLIVGLVVAIIVVMVIHNPSVVNWASVAWFAITFALGLVGYWFGGWASRRAWGDEMERRRRE